MQYISTRRSRTPGNPGGPSAAAGPRLRDGLRMERSASNGACSAPRRRGFRLDPAEELGVVRAGTDRVRLKVPATGREFRGDRTSGLHTGLLAKVAAICREAPLMVAVRAGAWDSGFAALLHVAGLVLRIAAAVIARPIRDSRVCAEAEVLALRHSAAVAGAPGTEGVQLAPGTGRVTREEGSRSGLPLAAWTGNEDRGRVPGKLHHAPAVGQERSEQRCAWRGDRAEQTCDRSRSTLVPTSDLGTEVAGCRAQRRPSATARKWQMRPRPKPAASAGNAEVAQILLARARACPDARNEPGRTQLRVTAVCDRILAQAAMADGKRFPAEASRRTGCDARLCGGSKGARLVESRPGDDTVRARNRGQVLLEFGCGC